MGVDIPTIEEMESLINEVRKNLNRGWIDVFLKENYPDQYRSSNSEIYITFRNYLNKNSYKSGIYPPTQFHFKLKVFFNNNK